MKQRTIMIAFLLLLSAGAWAQDRVSFLQMYAGLDYEYMPGTYGHNGTALEIGFDYNFHKNVYASLLFHAGNYDGQNAEGLSDSREEFVVAAGPGFNIICNGEDRIYAGLYAGYALVKAKRTVHKEAEGYDTPVDLGNKGFAAAARLGYEHAFGNGFILGGAVTAWYAGKEVTVTAGITLGFRFR